MSFKIDSVEGTAAELNIDLSVPTQHEREDIVVPVIKKAITDIVESLGGYLSVSANGNINPVSGETGDVVNIYVTSLPNPNPQTTTAPESAPEVQSGEPTPVTEETPQPQIPVTPENVEPQKEPAIEPSPPTSVTENPVEKTLEEVSGSPAPATEPIPPTA